MKVIAFSDIHFRENNPENRIDDYLDTLGFKLIQIVDYIRNLYKEKIIVVVGGDIFDSFRASDALKSFAIGIFGRMYAHVDEILVAAGQHDQRWHTTNLENTPLGVLIAAHVVTLLTEEPIVIEDCHFYGQSFTEKTVFMGVAVDAPLPKCQKDEKVSKILALHRMISDKDYWNGHVEYSSCESLLKEAKDFDLIITGDNHQTFNYKNKILNSGSLMRIKTNQKDHKPCFFVWDSKTKKVDQIFLKVEPFEKVMKIEEVEQKKEVDQRLINFVDELNINPELEEFKYVDNIQSEMHRLEEDVKDVVNECIEEIR